jgi:hypothetical protein
MTDRLEELKRELEKGRRRAEELERVRQELRDTMLRISGAIQVLEELLAQSNAATSRPELVAISA